MDTPSPRSVDGNTDGKGAFAFPHAWFEVMSVFFTLNRSYLLLRSQHLSADCFTCLMAVDEVCDLSARLRTHLRCSEVVLNSERFQLSQ